MTTTTITTNGDAGTEDASIVIDRIAAETIVVPILGTTPLIVHRFAEKAKRQMLDAMQGRKTPKQPKDPDAEYNAAFYRLPDGQPGFPVTAFKLATIGAARFYGSGVTMTSLRQCMFFHGNEIDPELVAIEDSEPHMREDVVRLSGRGSGTDLRYRPEFPTPWRVTLRVTFVKSMLTRNSLLSLIDAGGLGVGIGEWRVEKDGTHGCYCIDPDRTVEVLS